MGKALTSIHQQPPIRQGSHEVRSVRGANRLLSPWATNSYLMVLLAAFLPGCRNRADSSGSAQPGSPPVQVQPSGEAQADVRATLSSLTQLVRKYTVENKHVPGSFDELVAAGYITAVPPAPPGQKFVINPKGVQVILMKQ